MDNKKNIIQKIKRKFWKIKNVEKCRNILLDFYIFYDIMYSNRFLFVKYV